MGRFYEEIMEQPSALRNTLNYFDSLEGNGVLEKVAKICKLKNYQNIVFTGMGSSYFVSEAASSMLNSFGIQAQAIDTGELIHFRLNMLSENTLVVAISQSGESYEVVELLKLLGNRPIRPSIIGITNTPSSSLALHSDLCLFTMAGKEEMTSTKTFICTYLAAYLLVVTIAGGVVNRSELSGLANEIERLLSHKDEFHALVRKTLLGHGFIQTLARGPLFATASQTSLMFMEADKIPSSSLLGGAFRHGPLEIVDDSFVAVVFAHSRSGVYKQMLRLSDDILASCGKVLMVTDVASGADNTNYHEVIVNCEDPILFAIPSIVPLQIIVDAWAEERHLVPGDFNIASKVTITE